MRSDLLHVVAVYANPVRWESRRRLHEAFETHMLESGVRLTTVECAYGERPFELEDRAGVNRVRVRSRTMVWNKECLLNIGIARLPDDWKYLGTFDADIHFRKSGWAAEAVHALQHYHVMQPWSDCYDLGPDDDHLAAYRSFLRQWWNGQPVAKEGPKWWSWEGGPYQYGHCGYAWCWTRQAIEWLGGLLEIAALGAGDHHMALGLVGKAEFSLPGFISESYARHVVDWQSRAQRHINGRLGFIPGTIEHAWHGRKEDRKYVDRWEIIKRHAFDPDRDVKRNSYGVVELAGNKPGLALDLDRYFRQRDEDATTL